MEQELTGLFAIDFKTLIQDLFSIIAFVVAGCTLLGKFFDFIGKPIKWFNKQNDDHEVLQETIADVNEIRERQDKNYDMFMSHEADLVEKLEHLTKMFINKEINDYRWEIINFATRVSEGKPCNKESYKHCFKTYNDYEQLLEDNDLENGEVEVNMEIIREGYKQAMLNGFE